MLLLSPLAVRAQSTRSIVVRVFVTDSTGSRVPGADVAIVSGVNTVLASAGSDVSDSRPLHFSTEDSTYQVVVRKLGFARASRFMRISKSDTARVDIVLSRSVAQLAATNVTAEVNRSRARRFVDADAIAASDRTIYNAIDIIEKLRPDMTFEPPDLTGHCSAARNLWVNGVHVYAEMDGAKAPKARNTQTGQRDLDSKVRVGTALKSASDDLIYLLSTIRPEHIGSIEYHDCTNMSVGKIGSESALFIILKDGVAYENGRGSFVLPPSPPSVARLPKPAANVVVRSLDLEGRAAPLPAYRSRILGVFDADAGTALEGVTARDIRSPSSAVTSPSGTVSLAFLPDGGGRVVISKPGFRPDTITVRISPSDTAPVTALMSRIK